MEIRKMKVIFVALLILGGCSSAPEVPATTMAETRIPEQGLFNRGVDYLEGAKFEQALADFETFLVKNPISPLTPSATFYSGVALEHLGRFEEAEQKFRASLRLSEGRDGYMEAESLFQLAKSLEGQGVDDKALATLLDVERRSKYLRRETAEVEVPSRIASLYARQNQMVYAEKYYDKADKNLAKLRASVGKQRPAWFAKTLYNMGRMTPRVVLATDFENGLKSLRRSQSYLLRAVELNVDSWSEKSKEELQRIYESAWKAIQELPLEPTEDRLLALKDQQKQMISMGLVLNGVVQDLSRDILPTETKNNTSLAALEVYVQDYSKRLDALISSRPLHERLTPEAEAREGLLRKGKVFDPEGRLERTEKGQPAVLPAKKKAE